MLEVGDIVQVTDETHHWFPALVIVSEIKAFGCQAYMVHVMSNDPKVPNSPAFIRLKEGSYEKVGTAVVCRYDIVGTDKNMEAYDA